jgi:hypothetical protein
MYTNLLYDCADTDTRVPIPIPLSSAIYNPNGPAAIIAFLAFAAVTVALFTRKSLVIEYFCNRAACRTQ